MVYTTGCSHEKEGYAIRQDSPYNTEEPEGEYGVRLGYDSELSPISIFVKHGAGPQEKDDDNPY